MEIGLAYPSVTTSLDFISLHECYMSEQCLLTCSSETPSERRIETCSPNTANLIDTLYRLCSGNSMKQPKSESPKDTASYWASRAEYRSWKEAKPGGGKLRSRASKCLGIVSSCSSAHVRSFTGLSRKISLEHRKTQTKRASLATGGTSCSTRSLKLSSTRSHCRQCVSDCTEPAGSDSARSPPPWDTPIRSYRVTRGRKAQSEGSEGPESSGRSWEESQGLRPRCRSREMITAGSR